MKTNYIYSIITKYFDNDMPKEVQVQFRNWFLQPEDAKEKEDVLSNIFDIINIKADVQSDILDVKSINADVQSDILDVKSINADVQSDILDVKSVNSDVQSNILDVKSINADVQSDILDVKSVNADVQSNILDVKSVKADVQSDILDVKSVNADVHSNILDIKSIKADDKTYQKYAKLDAHIRFTERRKSSFLLKRIAVVAAMFLLLVGTAWLTWNIKDLEDEEAYYIVEAPLGEKSKLTLPDGTIVWLNAGSQLTYSSHFNRNHRNVSLIGEGHFEVSRQQQKDFIVYSAGCGVHVKGTIFNVRSYPEDPTMEVSLYEGSVYLSTPSVNNEETIYMQPGEKINYNKTNKTIQKEMLPFNDDLLWKDGYYHFSNKSLGEIATELERVFDVHINIRDHTIAENRYHISFVNHESLPDMLNAINNDNQLIIIYNKDTIEIRK